MHTKFVTHATLLATALFATTALAEFQKGYATLVGSTAVLPYAKAIGDKVASQGRVHAPLVQALGTGGSIKLFCEGMGPESPDVALASREMKEKEKAECARNGINVLELKIGYDAMILGQSLKAEPWTLSSMEARMAFAKWLVGPDGAMVLNPNKTWRDIKSSLPATPIELLGPPMTSSTHEELVDMISGLKCKGKPWIPEGSTAPTEDLLHKCRSIREDRVYQEGREDDMGQLNMIARADHAQIGVFDYKMIQDNADKIRPIPIDGVSPTYENIASGAYVGVRPMYFYIKMVKIGSTPGLKEILGELITDRAWGDKGYLRDLGLIAMPLAERTAAIARLEAFGVTPGISTPVGSAPAKSDKPAKAKKARH